MSYYPKNILVTGGAGFIGSHYVDLCIAKGNTVVNLDALTYAGKMENMETVSQNPLHHFVHGNICDKKLVASLLEKYAIDTIVHFAAESHVDRSIQGPEIFLETNIMGTHVLLEAAKNYWIDQQKWNEKNCRFHMISTDEVFGSLNENDPAFTEKSQYQPNSPYSASKASADHLVRAYQHTYHLPTTLSHCSNNYGTRQDKEKLIPKIISICQQEKKIPVYGSGLNRRDWIHVIDHCNMVDWVVRQGKVGESYNLGAQCERTNLEVIHLICGIFDELKPRNTAYATLIEHVADRAGHDFRYAINSTKALSEGCPKAVYELESTLRNMIKEALLEKVQS